MKPEGYHEHHRQLRRGGDERPVNKLFVGHELHDWIHKHPAEAQELGWIVSQYQDPAEVVVVIPDRIVAAPKKSRAKAPATAREKKRLLVHVPAEEENLLPETIDAAREHLAPQMGWGDDVPAYFVLMAALVSVLQT